MYGRSFGTANGDYIVPERYGGTVYKRPAEKTEPQKSDAPRMAPVSGGIHLSQKAAEMHEKDIKRITGEEPNETPSEKVPETAELNSDGENDVKTSSTAKRHLADISEEDLLIIGLMILMLSGASPLVQDGGSKSVDSVSETQKSDESPEEIKGQAESISAEGAEVVQKESAPSPNSGDDILIPLLLTLLIW